MIDVTALAFSTEGEDADEGEGSIAIPAIARSVLRSAPFLAAALLAGAVLLAEEPPAVDLAVDWARFRDLEILVARVESEGHFQEKKQHEPISRVSWGTALPILPAPELVFPVETPEQDLELAFFARYLKEYGQAVDGAKDASAALAKEFALLKDADAPFPAFAQKMLARYKPEDAAVGARDAADVAAKKRAAGEIVRYLLRLPIWEKEFKPLLDAPAGGIEKEWERRLAEANKLVKRFEIGKDVGTGQLSGSSVFDVRLGPTGLELAKNIFGSIRTWPVVGPDGKAWKINGAPLLVSSEKTLPDINSYVKDIRNEYVVFRYRQIGFGDDKTKDVIRLVCARLYLGPRYFLFYRDRVILFLKDRPGK